MQQIISRFQKNYPYSFYVSKHPNENFKKKINNEVSLSLLESE